MAKPDALLHHSDVGSQYSSDQFQRLMAGNGVVCSMRRSGKVWDNAAMESFFSSLKTERIGKKVYRTRDDARADVFDYLNCLSMKPAAGQMLCISGLVLEGIDMSLNNQWYRYSRWERAAKCQFKKSLRLRYG